MKIFNNITIIAPHPDDEILGCGGIISRFSKTGAKISILFISGHLPPLYKEDEFLITQKESFKALGLLGVKKKNISYLKIPATRISDLPISELNSKIYNFINKNNSDTVFTCFPDRHIDHKLIFEASMVATRPVKLNFPKFVFLYETLSETHWNIGNVEPNFVPNFYIDISKNIAEKVKAMNCYKSQIKNNSSRSTDALIALSKFRGSQNGCQNAEAFQLARGIY